MTVAEPVAHPGHLGLPGTTVSSSGEWSGTSYFTGSLAEVG